MTGDRIRALARGSAAVLQSMAAKRLYEGRFSPTMADALIKAGIDAPERLLFMSTAEIASLPGIGADAQQEITVYQARFRRGRDSQT
jgi:hypothetical protein